MARSSVNCVEPSTVEEVDGKAMMVMSARKAGPENKGVEVGEGVVMEAALVSAAARAVLLLLLLPLSCTCNCTCALLCLFSCRNKEEEEEEEEVLHRVAEFPARLLSMDTVRDVP